MHAGSLDFLAPEGASLGSGLLAAPPGGASWNRLTLKPWPSWRGPQRLLGQFLVVTGLIY